MTKSASNFADMGPFRPRAAFYIDGFNLYHAIDGLNEPFLKWVNLKTVAELLMRGRLETVTRVVYCSASRTDDSGKQTRHRQYTRALEAEGVELRLGYFADDNQSCRSCHATWTKKTEKEGDVSLALAILDDAYQNLFDVAYIVTADGDQAPTFRTIKIRFPSKQILTVAPPGRSHNHKIRDLADGRFTITRDHLEQCLFPRLLQDTNGNAVLRPTPYDPPSGWIAPKDRPKKRG